MYGPKTPYIRAINQHCFPAGLDPELLRFVRARRLSLLRVDDWIVVQRRSFDATVDSEPYHSVQGPDSIEKILALVLV